MKIEQTECSETSAYKIQTPENYPEESLQQLYLLFGGFRFDSLQCINYNILRTMICPYVLPRVDEILPEV
jgi:hypothetical protein